MNRRLCLLEAYFIYSFHTEGETFLLNNQVKSVVQGKSHDVLTQANLKTVYDMDV